MNQNNKQNDNQQHTMQALNENIRSLQSERYFSVEKQSLNCQTTILQNTLNQQQFKYKDDNSQLQRQQCLSLPQVQQLNIEAQIQVEQEDNQPNHLINTQNILAVIYSRIAQFQAIYLVPVIPISQYKCYLQYFLLVQSIIQIISNFNSIILLWQIWFVLFGFWRFKKQGLVRFIAQFFLLILWIYLNVTIYGAQNSQSKLSLFNTLILMINVDYYLIGSGNLLTYIYWICLALYTCCSNYRLSKIQEELNKKRQRLINQLLANKRQRDQMSQQRDICSICLQQNGDNLVILYCGHFYDLECIKTWIQTNNSCPVCRAILY